MSQSNPDLKLPEMPLPPEPPPENDFPCCCSQPAPSCCKSGSNDLLTASEVKLLTETAGEIGRRIGWKAAGEEIAVALERVPLLPPELQSDMDRGVEKALDKAARIARSIASQPSGAVSDATSGVPGHPEVSEAVRSPQERCGLADVDNRCEQWGDPS